MRFTLFPFVLMAVAVGCGDVGDKNDESSPSDEAPTDGWGSGTGGAPSGGGGTGGTAGGSDVGETGGTGEAN